MDKIILNDISAFGYHGVMEAEKELGQNFLIDLEVGLDLKEAGTRDELGLTADYVGLQQLVRKVVREESFNLIEAVAEKIANQVFAVFKVSSVRVKVKKTFIPAIDFSGNVSVEISRFISQI